MTKLPKLGLCSARVCWPLINRVMNMDGQDEQDFFLCFLILFILPIMFNSRAICKLCYDIS